MNEIILNIAASVIALFLILLLMRLRYDRLVKEIWRSLKIQSKGLVLTLNIDAEGRLLKISLPRWSGAKELGWRYSTFIAQVKTEQTFGGYSVPSSVSVGWLDADQT